MRIDPTFRPLVAGLSLLAAVLLWPLQPARADADVFQVSGIPVDVTAETAAEAREAALAEGHREAFRRLMARLVLEEDQVYVPDLGQSEIAQLVQDFSVSNERTSTVRYLADLTFRFKPDAVRELFRYHRLRFTETRSKPILVLPVMQTEAGALLWEEANRWAVAWAERDFSGELVPLLVPLGDLGDVAVIDAQRALSGDQVALADIALRYGADEVLVAQAALTGDPETGAARLEMAADRFGETVRRVFDDSFVQTQPSGTDALLGAGVDMVVASVQADWKEQNHLSFDEQRMLSAVVPVTELNDWLEVKRRLEAIASVIDMNLVYLTRQYAQVDISFIGDEAGLSRSLARQDLSLSRSALAGWELRLSAAAAGSAIPLDEPQPLPGIPAGDDGGGTATEGFLSGE